MPALPDPRDFPPDDIIKNHVAWGIADANNARIRDELALHLGEIARYAGGLILEAVERGFNVYCKPDGSSYTDADVQAEQYILKALHTHFPAVPVIAEEQMAAEMEGTSHTSTLLENTFFLVDPLDGTRDFCKGGLEYTVNIAVIINGTPIAGAVYAPADGRLWIGGANTYTTSSTPYAPGQRLSEWRKIHTRTAPKDGLIALASRRSGNGRTHAFLNSLPIKDRVSVSSSVKFCLIAQGDADVYPRFGQTMEWDTAAGDAILRAAGGMVVDEKGRPLVYGRKQEGYENGPFIAWGHYPDLSE